MFIKRAEKKEKVEGENHSYQGLNYAPPSNFYVEIMTLCGFIWR